MYLAVDMHAPVCGSSVLGADIVCGGTICSCTHHGAIGGVCTHRRVFHRTCCACESDSQLYSACTWCRSCRASFAQGHSCSRLHSAQAVCNEYCAHADGAHSQRALQVANREERARRQTKTHTRQLCSGDTRRKQRRGRETAALKCRGAWTKWHRTERTRRRRFCVHILRPQVHRTEYRAPTAAVHTLGQSASAPSESQTINRTRTE
eukprot:jgi/Antlo1/2083/1989